jgi:hypothetical protein
LLQTGNFGPITTMFLIQPVDHLGQLRYVHTVTVVLMNDYPKFSVSAITAQTVSKLYHLDGPLPNVRGIA